MIKGFLALAIASLVGFSAQAQADMSNYAGTYKGKFESTKGSFIVGANGGTLSASFLAANGSTDLLGESCRSSIGPMLKVDMDGNNIDYVVFAFDPGYCMMNYQGRELVLDFKHDGNKVSGLNASLYIETTTTTDWQCTGYPGGGSSCFPKTQTTDWYATGKFKK